MKIDAQYRQFPGSIWLKRGNTCYGAKWYGRGPVRKRTILEAMMRHNTRLGAPWLWD